MDGRLSTLWRCTAAAIAALAGLGAAVFSESQTAFLGTVVIASALAIVGLLVLISRPATSSLWELYAFILCFGYGLGTLQTFVGGYFLGFDPFSRAAVSAPSLSVALSLVLLLVSLLLTCSFLDRSGLIGRDSMPSSERVIALGLVGLVTIANVVMIALGRIRFGGDVAADADVGVRISATATLINESLPPFGALAMYCARNSSARIRAALLFFAAVDIFVLALTGRRTLLFSMLLFAMAYAAGGRPLRLLAARSLVVGLVMVLAVVVAARFFFAMRIAQAEAANTRDLPSLVLKGAEVFTDPDASGLDARLSENLADRAFILDYLAELLDKLQRAEPVQGAVLLNALVTAVPEALYPWKYNYMYPMEEAVVHPRFGMPVWDAANTVATAGVSDFGVLGMILYPVVTLMLCRMVISAASFAGPLAHLTVCFALIYMLLNVEIGLVSIFAGLRDTILIGSLVSFASWLARRLRSVRWLYSSQFGQSHP